MSKRGRDVLVLAELNADVIVSMADDPVFGQAERLVRDARLTLGSSGAITAAALAAQGVSVAICGVVGDDSTGDLVVSTLAALGVDTSLVLRRQGAATGMTVVLTRPDGDRSSLTHVGTMGDLRAHDVPSEAIRSARHVHVSSVYLQASLRAGLAPLLAQRTPGSTASIDPGFDPAREWSAVLPLLPAVDLFLPNENELAGVAAADGWLTGGGPFDLGVAAACLTHAVPTVVAKAGAQGAVATDGKTVLHVAADRAAEVVDTTGAGDNFDAGLIAALLDDVPLANAVARGVACGSFAVGGRGGTGRMANRAEANHLARDLAVICRHLEPVPARRSER